MEENKLIIIGSIAETIITFGLFFWRNLYAIFVFLFFAGFFAARNILIYILSTEISPNKNQVDVGAYCLSIDTLMAVIPPSIYLLAGGKISKTY